MARLPGQNELLLELVQTHYQQFAHLSEHYDLKRDAYKYDSVLQCN